MKNAVPINASYFAVQAILDIYRTQKENSTTNRALRSMMTLFSIKENDFVKAQRKKLLEVQSVDQFLEFVQSLSSKTINFYDDVDFKEITVCDTTPTLLKATFLLSHAAKSGVDKTVIGLTLRDIVMHIRPILVSKKMLSQLTQYNKNNKIGLWINGTIEHATPMNILRDKIIKAETEAELKSELERHLVIVYVTKEEDESIPKELRSKLPVNGTWKERYECSGIEIHEEEVKFPAVRVTSNTSIPFPTKFKGKTEIPSILSPTLSNQKR